MYLFIVLTGSATIFTMLPLRKSFRMATIDAPLVFRAPASPGVTLLWRFHSIYSDIKFDWSYKYTSNSKQHVFQ
jgi:hypothetical protein